MRVKTCFVVVFLAIGCASAPGASVWAQAPASPDSSPALRYTIDVRGWALKEALEYLVEATSISLIYDLAMVSGKRSSCQTNAAEAAALLRCVLRHTGLNAERLASGAFVMRKAPRPVSKPVPAPPRMRMLSGFVYDAVSGNSLRGAAVYEQAHQIGTTTNAAGHYRLDIPADSARLAVSHLGYEAAWLNVNLRGRTAHNIGLNPVVLWMDSLSIVADRDGMADDDSARSRVLFYHLRGLHVGMKTLRVRGGGAIFVAGYRFKGKYDVGLAFNRMRFVFKPSASRYEVESLYVVGPSLGYATKLSEQGWGARMEFFYHVGFGAKNIRQHGFNTHASVYRKYKIAKNTTLYPGLGLFADFASERSQRYYEGGVQLALPFTLKLKGKKKRWFVLEPLYRIGRVEYPGRALWQRVFGFDIRFSL